VLAASRDCDRAARELIRFGALLGRPRKSFELAAMQHACDSASRWNVERMDAGPDHGCAGLRVHDDA
jgi:hypothetical protein